MMTSTRSHIGRRHQGLRHLRGQNVLDIPKVSFADHLVVNFPKGFKCFHVKILEFGWTQKGFGFFVSYGTTDARVFGPNI